MTKSESTDIAWAISQNPLPSDLKAAIVEFTVNEVGTNTNYRQEVGLDLISNNIPKALSSTNPNTNLLTETSSIRNGIVFLSAVSGGQSNIQRIQYRDVGTLAGSGGNEIVHGPETSSSIQVRFMIYDSKVQDIAINGTSAPNYALLEYDLVDLSSNDWYLVIRDPETLNGFLDVSGKVALLV